jgi:GTP-binding protein EngB required for normal cell division
MIFWLFPFAEGASAVDVPGVGYRQIWQGEQKFLEQKRLPYVYKTEIARF